jgi:mycothiol synthase
MHGNFVVRNYHPQDFAAYVQLNLRFGKPEAMGVTNSVKTLARRLDRPNYRASEDLFVAEVDRAIVGYVNVTPELGIGRVVLDCLVHPTYCLRSMLKELLDHALERARKLRARVAHVNISSAELATAELLSNLGFNPIRRFYELRLDLSQMSLEAANQVNSVYPHLEPGEEERLAQIQNHCFTGTWGYNPNTAEEITWWMSFRGNSPEDVILAWDESKLIGYCWTGTNCGDDLSTGKSKGRIYMLGVDPDYRNRGIGRKLLLSGLSYLKNKGREIIDIAVDSENAVALRLYHSLGFEPWEETLWYEKIID